MVSDRGGSSAAMITMTWQRSSVIITIYTVLIPYKGIVQEQEATTAMISITTPVGYGWSQPASLFS